MARYTATIPQKPRSRHFRQYDGSQGRVSQISSSATIESRQEQQSEISVQETFNQLPAPPDFGFLGLTLDEKQMYIWDNDNQRWDNITYEGSVTKIVAGTNVSITPASGVGEVTINSTGGGSSGGSQSAYTVGYYTVTVPAGTVLRDTVATVINIVPGLPAGATVIGATYLVPTIWAFPIVVELSVSLTSAYLYCTLENDRSTPSTSYILVQYQKMITFGTTLQAGTNVSVTGNGSAADPYVVSSSGGSISSSTSADTVADNVDLLTDNSSASGSTVSYKYKKLTAGSGISIAGSSGAITISADGGGVSSIVAGDNITISPTTGKGDVTINGTPPSLSYSADTTSNLDILTDQTAISGNTINAKRKTLVAGTNMSITQTSDQIVLNSTSGASGVSKIVAGANVSISPTTGVGEVTINATGGGGGGGNVEDVTPGISTDTLKMYRYSVTPTGLTTIPANGYTTYQIPASNLPFTPLQAYATINYPGAVTSIYPLILEIIQLQEPNIYLVVFNPNANQVTINTNITFAILFMGV